MPLIPDTEPNSDFWAKALFKKPKALFIEDAPEIDSTRPAETLASVGGAWSSNLFKGADADIAGIDKMAILKDGQVIQEIHLDDLEVITVIGRHPNADIQLEAFKLGNYHVSLIKGKHQYFIEGLESANGTLVNRKKLKPEQWLPLRDGYIVDIPGYQLRFELPCLPATVTDDTTGLEELDEIPKIFYTPADSPPPPRPLLSGLTASQEHGNLWCEGQTTLMVADIIEETPDVKTFRLAGESALLFSYKPGQFVSLLLTINGKTVQRSYSLSSSPSRPHMLEITVKRVPGGLVSNWLCDHVKLGDRLRISGPSGKFTCFEYPSSKILFIGAGSGITPIMSMLRWIADTGADVDVQVLASFRSPADILFHKELELLAARHRSFQVALTVTADLQSGDTWNGLTGRISPQMIESLVPDFKERHLFMCGPQPFMESVKALMHGLQFNMSHFHIESFGTSRSAPGQETGAASLKLTGRQHKVTFSKTGITVDTDENISLLNLAEAHGIEIEYSCRSGSCGACAVHCAGEITESEECAIGAKEKQQGYIYCCCSVAKGDLVIDV